MEEQSQERQSKESAPEGQDRASKPQNKASERKTKKVTTEEDFGQWVDKEVEHAGEEIREAQRSVKLHHQIIYGVGVFVGVVLVWFGLWEFIRTTPVISNPAVSLVAGIVLLVLMGSFCKSLFGVYLPKD